MKYLPAVFTVLLAAFAVSVNAKCQNVFGVVTSKPDASCGIKHELEILPDDMGESFLFLAGVPDTCFSLVGSGTARFKGVSGLTSVSVAGADGVVTRTPIGFPPIFPSESQPIRAGLRGFTSRAVLKGRLTDGTRGKVFTRDTGIITTGDGVSGPPGFVGQVLIIEGGTGGFASASGRIAVAGQEVGGLAFYNGNICVPDSILMTSARGLPIFTPNIN